ncbi:MAG: hypothetical protein ACFFCS_24610 [Candidatus Hodarchaeota archaeon]
MNTHDSKKGNLLRKVIGIYLVFLTSGIILINMIPVTAFTEIQAAPHNGFNNSQLLGSISVNLSNYGEDEYEAYPVTLSAGKMYNITLNNTGDADFDVTLVNNITTKNYVSQVSSSVYTDELLTTTGVPWWGNYNTWSTIDFTSRVTNGITVNSGQVRSFLIYIDPAFGKATLPANFLVILGNTANPNNNILNIDWTQIDLSVTNVTIEKGQEILGTETVVNSSGYVQVEFATAGNADYTEIILNETITTNGSITLVNWVKDLSNNVKRVTQTLLGVNNEIYIPSFKNVKLDATTLPGFLINLNPSNDARLEWNYTAINDTTLTYSTMNLVDSSIQFNLNGGNVAWRVLDITDTSYFSLEFLDPAGTSQEFWDVSITFYAIGKDNNNLISLDVFGVNESETITIFTTRQDEAYMSTSTTFTNDNFQTFQYWLAAHGSINPQVLNREGTNKLGVEIVAIPTAATLNFSCTVDVTTHSISYHNPNTAMSIGADDGKPFGEFDIFQVRKFNFANFAKYKWEVKTLNSSSVISYSKLYCNDPFNDDKYPNGLNNSLFSTEINTTTITGNITLELEFELEIRANDEFLIYILNSSGIFELDSFVGIVANQTLSYNITQYSDENLQVIFNLTSFQSGGGRGEGPIIDNVNISNGTDSVFFDDFESDLSKWTQYDNNDNNMTYWHISSYSQDIDASRVNIVYPNNIYSITGYYADPSIFTGYWKVALGSDPYVQSSKIGYMVVSMDGILDQNISVFVRKTQYGPIELVNDGIIAADISYSQLDFQNGSYYLDNVEINDFYRYFSLNLEAGKKYHLKFSRDSSNLVFIDANIYSSVGIDWSDNFENYLGYFLINHTYEIMAPETEVIFIEFAPVAFGTTFTVSLSLAPQEELPWGWILTGILIGTNILCLWIIISNRTVIKIKFPKRRKA